MRIKQAQFDKLVAIASTLNIVLQNRGIEKVGIEICQGINEGKFEIMTTDDIYNFIDSVFEADEIEDDEY